MHDTNPISLNTWGVEIFEDAEPPSNHHKNRVRVKPITCNASLSSKEIKHCFNIQESVPFGTCINSTSSDNLSIYRLEHYP